MKAVYINGFAHADNLEFREVPDPSAPTGTEVLVRVRAAGLNRADLLQRRGLYPPPPGYSPNIPGLEFAGEVVAVGESVKEWRIGDRVFGITAGEGQAEMLISDASLLARIPDNLSFPAAAAVPEAFVTAHDAIFTLANLRKEETLLIHAVGSGVGLAALQMAKEKGVKVIGTSRTAEKLEKCKDLGLDTGIGAAGAPDFAAEVMGSTAGLGADVILDLVGAAYFGQNLLSLAQKGRLILVGLTSGRTAEFNLGLALHKRARIIGTVLRGRSLAEKADATRAFAVDILPLLANGAVIPNLDRGFAATDVLDAYAYLESNESFGKVVLEF